jgi:hypothetical protein
MLTVYNHIITVPARPLAPPPPPMLSLPPPMRWWQ